MRSARAIVFFGILAAAMALLGACASILGIEEIGPPPGALDGAAPDAPDSGLD
jgi:hypothetical protein